VRRIDGLTGLESAAELREGANGSSASEAEVRRYAAPNDADGSSDNCVCDSIA
jgi:hypothetical protein